MARPCIIVGAGGNIGEAIARRVMASGRKVALTHSLRSAPPPGLEHLGTDGKWYAVDVQNPASVDLMVRRVEADFGETPDLVYGAGIVMDGSAALASVESWTRVMETNLFGAFYYIRNLARPLMAAGNGRIVLIGSAAASKGTPGQLSYAAAKGALESMCRALAAELGRFGTTCNVVAPGIIEGRMIESIPKRLLDGLIRGNPLRKPGKPEDVASAVAYLLSEEAHYITGQVIRVDGGMTAV